MPAGGPPRSGIRISIGEVLSRLRDDFPDVSISKIRFLESEGLVQPARTSSGYRKFSADDVDRLRFVLTAQRDRYLPLRVIREQLDQIERGLVPAEAPGEVARIQVGPVADGPVEGEPQGGRAGIGSAPRLTADELVANSGLAADELPRLREFGLLMPIPGTSYYDLRSLQIATAIAGLTSHGLEPRHLRAFTVAVDRQAGLVQLVVEPLARSRDPEVRDRAEALRTELLTCAARLHEALLLTTGAAPLAAPERRTAPG
jgi:DNA-binding transcriptional MerR regulator